MSDINIRNLPPVGLSQAGHRRSSCPRATPAAAFTLIELMLMALVLGLLVVMAIPVFLQKESAAHTSSRGLPEFPWEPPTPSTYARIPDEFGLTAGEGRTFGDLALRLEGSLTKAGYSEKAYYSVPGGFALVCRLEQVDKNWVPIPVPHRWAENPPPLRSFSLAQYLDRLFLASPGHYRLLVFIMTDQPFRFDRRIPTKDEGKGWLFGGSTGLPKEMTPIPAAPGTRCFVLVYEFKKDDPKQPALFVDRETLDALMQLKRGGLFL